MILKLTLIIGGFLSNLIFLKFSGSNIFNNVNEYIATSNIVAALCMLGGNSQIKRYFLNNQDSRYRVTFFYHLVVVKITFMIISVLIYILYQHISNDLTRPDKLLLLLSTSIILQAIFLNTTIGIKLQSLGEIIKFIVINIARGSVIFCVYLGLDEIAPQIYINITFTLSCITLVCFYFIISSQRGQVRYQDETNYTTITLYYYLKDSIKFFPQSVLSVITMNLPIVALASSDLQPEMHYFIIAYSIMNAGNTLINFQNNRVLTDIRENNKVVVWAIQSSLIKIGICIYMLVFVSIHYLGNSLVSMPHELLIICLVLMPVNFLYTVIAPRSEFFRLIGDNKPGLVSNSVNALILGTLMINVQDLNLLQFSLGVTIGRISAMSIIYIWYRNVQTTKS